MSRLEIKGMGHYIPDNVITNDDLSKIMDTSDEWITKRTGIKERCLSLENTSVLAYKAACMALENANMNIDDIDLIVCATITPDDFTPSVACNLLKLFNKNNIMAFDINAACSGFVYALNVASSLMESNNYKNAIVIGAEVLSKLMDYNDRSTSILFGDGAGAAVISNSGSNALFYTKAMADARNVLYAKGISLNGLLTNSSCNDYYLQMNGQEVYKFAIWALEDGINNILRMNDMDLNDINYIIPHQANIRIIDSVKRKLNIDDKMLSNVFKYGNTSAASIPIMLSEAVNQNIVKKGDNVLLVGFGAGLTWASTIIKF